MSNELNVEKIKSSENKNSTLDIKGKKILFFSPAFFGYENKIAKKMEDLGAFVKMYDERSVTSAMDRALLKVVPNIFTSKSKNYYKNIIEENKGIDYDYILIIKCDMTPESILDKFRVEFPNAKLCLYLWDSVKNIPNICDKFKCFDTIHSFDLDDCDKYYEMKFRPLFYADEFSKKENLDYKKYDISFTGTIHSDRYAVIKQVREIAKEKGLNSFWFCYLQSKFIYYFYKFTKKEFADTKISDFDFDKMTSKEIADVVLNSNIVLDIQHPKQSGLTMRTIEMLGMNKKIITTNSSIKKYDFYNPNNICVVDRKNIILDEDFLKTQYQELDADIYEKYSLKEWLLEVLS